MGVRDDLLPSPTSPVAPAAALRAGRRDRRVRHALAFALGTGPTPPPKPLADAVHDALAAHGHPSKASARSIQLTDHLLEGANLASGGGGAGELHLQPADHRRLGAAVDRQGRPRAPGAAVRKGRHADLLRRAHGLDLRRRLEHALPLHAARPRSAARARRTAAARSSADHEAPSVAKIEEAIAHLGEHANVSGATPTDVAGQAAYTVRVSPKEGGSLLGGAELSWDADQRRAAARAIYSSTQLPPVIELAATEISYGPVESSVFEFTPPANAKVEEIVLPHKHPANARHESGRGGERPAADARTATASRRSRCSKAQTKARPARNRALPEGLPQVKINGVERDRAAHRARHAAQLRALRRALPARRLGQPGGDRGGRQGPVA